MNIQELIELLEKAIFELPVISTNIPTRKLIGEALDHLEQQPTARKFTKKFRKLIKLSEDHLSINKIGRLQMYGKEACDIIDSAEARRKVIPDLLVALEKYGDHKIDCAINSANVADEFAAMGCTCGLKAILAKAKQGGE